ncbi:MAG: BA14K family protein, partial [Alphaproteobacteria bacterium]|nr:BA14K family protein [Alphaproteobacteria bacterium]
NGYWFPAAAFAAGVAAATVAPPPPPAARLAAAHVRWCYDRYRSYRAWDNSYQPYDGPRRQCWSPYN